MVGIGRKFSYVLPVRMAEDEDTPRELTAYLRRIASWCEDVIVVDGSAPDVFRRNECLWRGLGRHVTPDQAYASVNGKVPGVLTGLDSARHDRVVIADDDVRYDKIELHRIVSLLGHYELVAPQNYFRPLPWHARWDTARTLLNRATIGADFPGTLAVRRSTLIATGGYDGDVLFENLELIRTVRAHGGTVASPLDLYVRRLPPTTAHFVGQRTRQAYDDFATPARMAVWLGIVPSLAAAAVHRRAVAVLVGAGGAAAFAEFGRRRAGGTSVFPVTASALAPLWLLERGVCAWLAVLQRLKFGGARYGDNVIRLAAHSERTLRRRALAGASGVHRPDGPSLTRARARARRRTRGGARATVAGTR